AAAPAGVDLHDHHGHPVLRLLRGLEHLRPQFAVLPRLFRPATPGDRDLGDTDRGLRDRAAPRGWPAGSATGGDALGGSVHRHRHNPRDRSGQRIAHRPAGRRGGRSRAARPGAVTHAPTRSAPRLSSPRSADHTRALHRGRPDSSFEDTILIPYEYGYDTAIELRR